MNKRKILSLAMALSIVAIMAVGATLAYFTDTDKDTNVMTVGNVDIDQVENFEQNAALLPAPEDTYGSLNHVKKEVWVENDGSLPAYIRTIFAFEDDAAGSITAQLHTLWSDINGTEGLQENYATAPSSAYDVVWLTNADGSWLTFTEDDVTYTVAVVTYKDALAPNGKSANSLNEVWLDDAATNDFNTAINGEYTIHALSQAVQVGQWETADEAFAEAFDAITADTLKAWF